MMLEYLYNIPNATTGMDDILVQEQAAVPSFIPLVLLFVFLIIFLGGIVRQKARTGTADYPVWGLVGCMVIFFMALIMSIIQGLINLFTLGIIILLTLLFGVWFFMDRRGQEV